MLQTSLWSPVGFLNLSRLLSGFHSGKLLITSHHPYGCSPELFQPASSHRNMTHLTSSFIKTHVAQHANRMTVVDNVADFLAGSRTS